MKKIKCPHGRTSAGHLSIKNHKIKLTFTNAFNFCILAEELAQARCLFMDLTRKWQFGNICLPLSSLTQKNFFLLPRRKRVTKNCKRKHNSLQKFTKYFFPFSVSISVTICSYLGGSHPDCWDGHDPARPYFPDEDRECPCRRQGEGLCEPVQWWRNTNAAQITTQHLTILPLFPLGVLTAPIAGESQPGGRHM